MPFKKHHEVTIYTDDSVMSALAKDYFRTAGIDFEEAKVENNPLNLAKLRELGVVEGVPMPVVDFDGRIVRGYQPDVYDILTKVNKSS